MNPEFKLSKRLHLMTKEEAIAEIIRFIDPEVVGAKDVCMTFHLANPDVPSVAFKLRDGVYSRADITIEDIHEDGLEVEEYEVSTREAFVAEMHKELDVMELPALLERVVANQTLAHHVAQLKFYRELRSKEAAEEIIAQMKEKAELIQAKLKEREAKQKEEE